MRKIIGARLREARLCMGQTQDAVAAVMGLSRQAISAWERGEAMPTLVEFASLATLLGASSDSLLFGVADVAGECRRALDRAADAKPEARPLLRLRVRVGSEDQR